MDNSGVFSSLKDRLPKGSFILVTDPVFNTSASASLQRVGSAELRSSREEMKINFIPIGIIHSPLIEPEGMPIQPPGTTGKKGTVEVFKAFHASEMAPARLMGDVKRATPMMKEDQMNTPERKLFDWRMLSPAVIAILLAVLAFASSAIAQNPKASQWQQAGGEMILPVSHEFVTSWTSDGNSREKGLYWAGGFYDPVEKRQYAPWDNTVSNSVAPELGQITVRGPGIVALFERTSGGASIYMRDPETKAIFYPFRNTLTLTGAGTWDGSVRKFGPGEFWGRIKPGEVVTIDVGAAMSAYDNRMNTGEYSFHAPQKVLGSEVWFFPEAGGKVIESIKICPDGKKLDITNGDRPCNSMAEEDCAGPGKGTVYYSMGGCQ